MTHRPIQIPVATWTLPVAAIQLSFDELAADGLLRREGISLWAGRRRPSASAGAADVDVTHVILLRGDGIVRDRGFIGITPALLNDVTDALADIGSGVYLIGQIHSHPPYCSIDLSPTDITYGIAAPHFLSVVAPRFGMDRGPTIASCGVHVFEPPLWYRLTEGDAARRIVVSDDAVQRVVVGDAVAVPTSLRPGLGGFDVIA